MVHFVHVYVDTYNPTKTSMCTYIESMCTYICIYIPPKVENIKKKIIHFNE